MNKASLLILGAGGHAKVAAEVAAATGAWQSMAFLDDDPRLESLLSWPVLGKLGDVEACQNDFASAFVALGGRVLRQQWTQKLQALDMQLATLVHPSAVISPSARLGAATVVMPQAAVNAETVMGEGVILNTAASIDHDCVIGDYAHISPGVRLAGGVTLGRGVWVGMGAVIIEGVCVAENAIIGAGAVVLDDVAAGHTVAGVPARPIGRAAG